MKKNHPFAGSALLLALVTCWACLSSACASNFMTAPPEPTELTPTRGDATVVFLRPSRLGGSSKVHIAADTVGYIGTLLGAQKVVVQVPAGSHLFYSWADNTDVVQAELAPGKVYYLLVGMQLGTWNARHSLSRFTSDRREWTEFKDYQASTNEVVRKSGAAGAGPPQAELASRLSEAQRKWAALGKSEKRLRTLTVEDGQDP